MLLKDAALLWRAETRLHFAASRTFPRRTTGALSTHSTGQDPRHEKRFRVRPHPDVAKLRSASDRRDLRRLSPGGVGVPLATGVLIFALQGSARAGALAAKNPREREGHPPLPTGSA